MASESIEGVGLGFRKPYLKPLLDCPDQVPWLEIITENYIHQSASQKKELDQLKAFFPLTCHGVSLSLGSTDPLNWTYLESLKALIDDLAPIYVSDHLSWVSFGGDYVPDLLPLPYTEEALKHVVGRIKTVQEYLGRRILIENVSSYMIYDMSTFTEWAFLKEVVEQADCDLLLDVNNVYVSAYNHDFDPKKYIQHLPFERIKEIHLAGYECKNTHLLDTHSQPVHKPVWALYAWVLEQMGPVPTLIEWDAQLPTFEMILNERNHAQGLYSNIHAFA